MPAPTAYLALLRVSTTRQGESQLGLDAQLVAIQKYLEQVGGRLIADPIVEIESGAASERPKLEEAVEKALLFNATLLVAKIDRLGRDAHVISGLQKRGVKFIAVDMPTDDPFLIGVQALFADSERRRISQRTKDALQALKRRGGRLGGRRANGHEFTANDRQRGADARACAAARRAQTFAPVIAELRTSGAATLGELAAALNAKGYPTARGGQWHPEAVRRVLGYINPTVPTV